MTSRRRVLGKRSKDELGALIRWSLRERVADAAPSPQVWDRIREQADRAVPRQPRLNFASFMRGLIAWLLVETYLPPPVVRPTRRGEVVAWGRDVDWIRALGQHHMVVRPIS
jgi:hypothetical protein